MVTNSSRKTWKLPESPVIALGLAILGHALWNGSSWGVGYLTRDLSWDWATSPDFLDRVLVDAYGLWADKSWLLYSICQMSQY